MNNIHSNINSTTNKNAKKQVNKQYKDKTNTEILGSINPTLLENARKKIQNMDEESKNNLKTSISWFFLPDNLKKITREKIQARMKIIDIFSLILAAIGIMSNIIASSLYIKFEKIQTDNLIDVNVIGTPSNTVTTLRWITTGSTFILLLLVLYHYITRLQFHIFKQRLEISSNIFSSKLIFFVLLEFCVCAIHTPPYLDNVTVPITTSGENPVTVQVDLDLILSMIIPLRVYLLFRYYSFYSPWADDKAEKVCNDCNTLGGISFAIKAELKERPYFVVGVLMVLSIVIFGYGLRNVEVAFIKSVDKNLFQDWTYIWNGFWCIIITILTVGYGDYYPQTHLGRMISVVACLWGTFLISLMVVSLTISVEFTPQEEKAYEELKNNETNFQLRAKAVKLIKLGHDLKRAYEEMSEINDKRSKKEYINKLNEFNLTLNDFRVIRKNVISKEHEVSAETILHKLNHNVTEQMEQMIQLSNFHVTSLMDYIKLAKDVQSQISDCSDRLETLTRGLYDCIKEDEETDYKEANI